MTQAPVHRVQRTHRPSRFGFLFFLIIVLGLLLLAAVSLIAWHQWRYSDKIYPGISVAGMPVGGLTVEEASSAIHDALTPYPGPDVTVRFGDRSWVLSSETLGVSVDAGATAAQAFRVGREGLAATASASVADLLAGLKEDTLAQWEAFWDGVNLQPVLQRDDDLLDITLRRIAGEVDLKPVEGTLSIVGLEVSGTPGRMGRSVDVETTHNALATAVRRGLGGSVDLVVQEHRPAVMDVETALTKARAVLGHSFIIVAETSDDPQRFSADAAKVRQWLTLTPVSGPGGVVDLDVTLDHDQVRAFVAGIAEQLDRTPYDATLDWDATAGKVIVLKASQAGQKVDVEAGVAALEAALAAPVSVDGRGSPVPQEIRLPVATVSPTIDSDRVGEMGIVELVSEGTTSFKGSPAERVHNIVNAASKFQHVVVPPGEEFSFNRNVGDVSAANGFEDALVIAGDRTAVGIGGGVCQVSTTAFRAAFWGGFPITERWAHGYVVSWYGQPGMDASIFTPNVDFRFRNDTGHFLLIKAAVNKAKATITFYIYGTKGDRTVEMSGPLLSNVKDPPPPLYQEDSTLAKGQIKQVDWAKEGMDAVVTRTIRYGDGKVQEEKIVSRYRPWQAVFLYGPGTSVPGQTEANP